MGHLRPETREKWQVLIGRKNKVICLGTYSTQSEALKIYNEKKQQFIAEDLKEKKNE